MQHILAPIRRMPARASLSVAVPRCAAFSTDAAPAAAAASAASSIPRRPSMKESTTEAAQRSFALRLYKAIMRAHRAVLPEAMRSLGDTYVREEFKLHKTAKPQHLHGFFTAWIGCQQGGNTEMERSENARSTLKYLHQLPSHPT